MIKVIFKKMIMGNAVHIYIYIYIYIYNQYFIVSKNTLLFRNSRINIYIILWRYRKLMDFNGQNLLLTPSFNVLHPMK